MEALFDGGGLDEFLRQAEQTCRQLDALIENGSSGESARARAAMAGYGKALELLQEIRAEVERLAQAP